MTKYKKGDVVTGIVTGIENYGIFVSLDEKTSGLIHISEISNSFVKNVNDYADVNESIKVKIIDNDENNTHIKLSIKDINYRLTKKKKIKIKETKSGFSTLNEKLNDWISIKEKEILEKK